MSFFNWSAVISGIALIVAIVSPVITTILANQHQDKIWARDNFRLYKSTVIEQYVKNTGTALKRLDAESMKDYGNSYGEIFFYTSKEVWPLIERIDDAVTRLTIGRDVQETFAELCKKLASEGKRPEK